MSESRTAPSARAVSNGAGPMLRSDIASMLMPFFPEDRALTRYVTEINGYSVMITSDEGRTIATSSDRKILNFLAGALADAIRSGRTPSRHIEIELRPMIETLSQDSVTGGAEYQRIRDRLSRLMATVIETEMPIGDGIKRRRRFRWIDAFEHDDKETPGGRKILDLRISLSEDAFHWMTRSLGFDMTRNDFQAITATRSSAWRIYEICLASLANAPGRTVAIPIAEIRDRVPISSELKIFKSRTLRSALDAIAENPGMSSRIMARLATPGRRGMEIVDFSRRLPLDQVYVLVAPGKRALPVMNRLIEPAAQDMFAPGDIADADIDVPLSKDREAGYDTSSLRLPGIGQTTAAPRAEGKSEQMVMDGWLSETVGNSDHPEETP